MERVAAGFSAWPARLRETHERRRERMEMRDPFERRGLVA